MKTKIVLWGENEKEEKVLIGIELIESDNVVRIYTIPEGIATEIFYNQMMNQWRNGVQLSMPEGTTTIDRPLTMTDSLLPDDLKTDRQDILARAKTEWHFIVLSSKLYRAYADELSELKERADQLLNYDEGVWEELKGFWSKVQEQVREKNIFREHASELRARTNQIFDNLKSLRKALNDEYEKLSREHLTKFYEKLDDIEKRIESGLGLHPIFNELKDIQKVFRDTKFTRKHHNDVWKRIDKAFKLVKEKKYGSKGSTATGAVGRLESRYNGLMSAIGKMEASIGRDRKDEAFQLRRINTTDGQLELQIRQAKMAMIQERITSKQVKLDDMLKTKGELEKRIELEKKKAEAKAAKKAEQAKLKKAKEEIKGEIAKDIESNAAAMKAQEEKLQKAAEAIKAVKEKRKKAKEKNNTPPPIESTKESEAPAEGGAPATSTKPESVTKEKSATEAKPEEEVVEDTVAEPQDKATIEPPLSTVAETTEQVVEEVKEVAVVSQEKIPTTPLIKEEEE